MGLALGGNMKRNKLAALVLAGALCVSTLTGCSVSPDKAVATLGEETVTYEVANFVCKYQKAAVEDFYLMYLGEDAWSLDVTGSGSTLEEDLKTNVMAALHDMYTLKAHMADYAVELTDEDEAAIQEAVSAFLAANTEEALEEMGATEESVTEVLALYTIQAKMYKAIIADADTNVSDEEAAMRGYSVIQIDPEGYYAESGSYTQYTDEEAAEISNTVSKMELALKEKTLEEVADEYGYEVTANAYEKEDAAINADLLTALDALKEGETSGKIETDSYIYFARIDADIDSTATEENRQEIIAERQSALYDEVLTGWQENDGWTVDEKLVDKIDFHHIFTQAAESTESEAVEDVEDTQISETNDGTESE